MKGSNGDYWLGGWMMDEYMVAAIFLAGAAAGSLLMTAIGLLVRKYLR